MGCDISPDATGSHGLLVATMTSRLTERMSSRAEGVTRALMGRNDQGDQSLEVERASVSRALDGDLVERASLGLGETS